jgi:hypothetical protein
MAAKGTFKIGEATKSKIVAAKLAGKPQSVIAHEVGVSDAAVSVVLSDPTTQQLFPQIRYVLRDLIVKASQLVYQDCVKILETADKLNHEQRLKLHDHVLRVVTHGEIAPPQAPAVAIGGDGSPVPTGGYKLEELLISVRRATAGPPEMSPQQTGQSPHGNGNGHANGNGHPPLLPEPGNGHPRK